MALVTGGYDCCIFATLILVTEPLSTLVHILGVYIFMCSYEYPMDVDTRITEPSRKHAGFACVVRMCGSIGHALRCGCVVLRSLAMLGT